ncbi:MAG: hypothetical protein RIR48_1544 [Bacteroidota bacterium]|jgi:hypothetical protein
MKEQRVIKVEIPKEIWDAHMSIFNFRDIIGAWMKSIDGVVNQMSKQNENEQRGI